MNKIQTHTSLSKPILKPREMNWKNIPKFKNDVRIYIMGHSKEEQEKRRISRKSINDTIKRADKSYYKSSTDRYVAEKLIDGHVVRVVYNYKPATNKVFVVTTYHINQTKFISLPSINNG